MCHDTTDCHAAFSLGQSESAAISSSDSTFVVSASRNTGLWEPSGNRPIWRHVQASPGGAAAQFKLRSPCSFSGRLTVIVRLDVAMAVRKVNDRLKAVADGARSLAPRPSPRYARPDG